MDAHTRNRRLSACSVLVVCVVAASVFAFSLLGTMPTELHAAEPFASGMRHPPAWAAHHHPHFFSPQSATPSPKGRGLLGPICVSELRNLRGFCPKPPLHYYGGAGVQHSPIIYPVLWGSNWNVAEGAILKEQIMGMYRALSGSAYQGILTQYYDTTGHISSTVTVAEPYIDTSVAAPTEISLRRVYEEIARAIAARRWSRTFSAQFEILTPPGASVEPLFYGRYCGFHDNDETGSSYSFVPYAGSAQFSSCTTEIDGTANPYRATASVASHEYAEIATDPRVSSRTWATEELAEIADLCQSGDDRMSAESEVWVQGLWDNYQNSCSLSDSSPPHAGAITEGPAEVTATSASLHGTVNPEGFATHYHFEYGTTTAYGTSVPARDVEVGGGASNHAVEQAISGLASNVTYHYRLVATNSEGTAYGPDEVIAHWRTQTAPTPIGGSAPELLATSCTASTACTTVGTYFNRVWGAMGDEWEGRAWRVASIIANPGTRDGALRGVSCISSTACEAVGNYTNSSGVGLSMAQVRSGASWSVQTTPNPTGSTVSELRGMSCIAANACTAVGSFFNRVWGAMGETWDGSRWVLANILANPVTKNGGLLGVSCVTATRCEAVGGYGDGNGEEEMYTIGRTEEREWAYQVNATNGQLNAVSCTARNFCMAVGVAPGVNLAPVYASAKWWDGAAWANVSIPSPPGAIESFLNGISCTGADPSRVSCYAVGNYKLRIGEEPPVITQRLLIEHWNGRVWSIEENIEEPAGSTKTLTSVACSTEARCVATGYTEWGSIVETF